MKFQVGDIFCKQIYKKYELIIISNNIQTANYSLLVFRELYSFNPLVGVTSTLEFLNEFLDKNSYQYLGNMETLDLPSIIAERFKQ